MNAGPGKTSRAMPISRTVAPITETITRLTILMFSRFQTLERRFIQCRRVIGRFTTRQIIRRSLLAVELDRASTKRGTQTVEKRHLCWL